MRRLCEMPRPDGAPYNAHRGTPPMPRSLAVHYCPPQCYSFHMPARMENTMYKLLMTLKHKSNCPTELNSSDPYIEYMGYSCTLDFVK